MSKVGLALGSNRRALIALIGLSRKEANAKTEVLFDLCTVQSLPGKDFAALEICVTLDLRGTGLDIAKRQPHFLAGCGVGRSRAGKGEEAEEEWHREHVIGLASLARLRSIERRRAPAEGHPCNTRAFPHTRKSRARKNKIEPERVWEAALAVPHRFADRGDRLAISLKSMRLHRCVNN